MQTLAHSAVKERRASKMQRSSSTVAPRCCLQCRLRPRSGLLLSLFSLLLLAQCAQAVDVNNNSDVKQLRHSGDDVTTVGDRKGIHLGAAVAPERVVKLGPERNRTQSSSENATTPNSLEDKITNRRSLVLDSKEQNAGILLERTNLDTTTDFDQIVDPPILHIQLASIEEAVSLLEELGGRFPVTLDHRAPDVPNGERVHFEVNDQERRNRTSTNRVVTTTQGAASCAAKAPRWIKRGNVCKSEVHRFHGFTKRLLDLVHTSRNCRMIFDRFVCVESFGSGEFAPTRITSMRCCDGYKLTLNRAFCRRRIAQPGVNRPVHRRPIARRRRPNTRQRPNPKAPNNRVSFKPNRPTRVRPGPGPSAVDRHLFRSRTTSNYTTFVPNDQILENDVGADGIVEEIFDNLVIANQLLMSEDLRNNDIYSAISGNPIRFNFFSNRSVMTVNCMSVSSRDFRPDFDQSNHIYHVIEGLLAHIRTTITGYIQQRPQVFSSLISALTRLNMLDELDDENNSLTLFAPINEAFQMLTTSVESESDSCLRELIESHVVDQVYCSPASAMEIVLHTRNNKTLYTTYDVMFSTSYVNNSELIKSDVMTYNGVIHFLPSTLYRVRTLADELLSFSKLSAFHELVRAMDMMERLAQLRNVTLVTPYNSAFEVFTTPERIEIMRNHREWGRRLNYHMIKTSQIDLQAIKTSPTNLHRFHTWDESHIAHITKYSVKIRVKDDGSGRAFIGRKNIMSFQCARISSHQLTSSSCAGSILTTDQIPKSSSTSLLTIMEETHSGNFSTFLRLIRQAGLEERLQRATDFTLFAPTNKVLDSLKPQVMTNLFGNREKAQKFILFHFIPGFKCSDELMLKVIRHRSVIRHQFFTCPKRERLLVGALRKKMRARVVIPDLLADNGIIHGINNLLLYTRTSNHKRKA